MSCELSCENGLDSIAGRGRKVGVGPLRRSQDRVWKRVVHAKVTDRIRWVQSMSQAPDLRCDSTLTINGETGCQCCFAYHDSLTAANRVTNAQPLRFIIGHGSTCVRMWHPLCSLFISRNGIHLPPYHPRSSDTTRSSVPSLLSLCPRESTRLGPSILICIEPQCKRDLDCCR